MLKKNHLLLVFLSLTFCLFISFLNLRCKEESLDRRRVQTILDWNKLILELEQNTPGYRAPVTARMLAYVGLGKYLAAKEICPPVKIDNLISDLNNSQSETLIDIEPGIAVSKCMNVLLKLFLQPLRKIIAPELTNFTFDATNDLSATSQKILIQDHFCMEPR